jgi:hypothetical protein
MGAERALKVLRPKCDLARGDMDPLHLVFQPPYMAALPLALVSLLADK